MDNFKDIYYIIIKELKYHPSNYSNEIDILYKNKINKMVDLLISNKSLKLDFNIDYKKFYEDSLNNIYFQNKYERYYLLSELYNNYDYKKFIEVLNTEEKEIIKYYSLTVLSTDWQFIFGTT